MDERDRKIQELERQLEETRREADALRRGTPQFRYGEEPARPGPGGFRYHQQPAPPPKARPGRVALIIVGCLAALAAMAAALMFLIFTVTDMVDKETTAMAEELLQAVVEQDADRAYALIYPGSVSREEFDQDFARMCAVWREGNGGDTFALRRTSYSMNSSGGLTHCTSVYRVTSGQARFVLQLSRMAFGETTGINMAQLGQ